MKQFGRYQVIDQLGAGGMARVYRAHDPRLRREVAVKVISTFVSDKDKSHERFSQEAAVMAQLAHPAIVPIYDFGEQDGHPYIVMRLMRGGSLGDRLKQEGPLSLAEVTGLLQQLAPALEMAHGQGMVHRDLKPDNILLDQSGNASIADFGLAKILNASIAWTKTGQMHGSPPYMSPEQAVGRSDLDQQSDIYSLGVIVFEALTGKWPYESDNPIGFGMMHNYDPIPNICNLNPNLPAGCKEIIERVLAKKPQERYASVTALVEALNALPSGHAQTIPLPNIVDYLTRGNEYYQQRQYDLAISQYNEAVRLRPDDANALLSRGNAYYSKGEYDLAIANYTETLRIQPNYGTAYYNRGNAYQYQRQFDLAIADYDQALRINPNNEIALLERGNVYSHKGQLDEAIADYDEALRIKPNYAQASKKRQEAALKRDEAIKKQQEAEAEAEARRKAAHRPNPVDYLTRGYQYYQQRNYDLAISQYNEAVRLRPDDANALLSRANAYYSKGEYDLAIADYTETVRIQPNYATAYYNRGNAYQYQRQLDLAIADYDQALRINPNNLTALLERGNVCSNKGQLEEAIADYDEALRINPNYAQAARKRQEAIMTRQEAIKKEREGIINVLINRQQAIIKQKEAEARARQEAAQKVAAEQKRHQQEAEARRKAAAVKKAVADALATMPDHTLPPKVRAEAGRKLAQLGDPRPEVMTVDGMEFCFVSAGPFWMGNKVETKPKSGWFSFLTGNKQDNKNPPLHQLNIPYGYWVGRYPVTNAQFQEFVKGGGYGYEPDWAEAKRHGHWKNGKIRGRDRPYDFGTPYTLPNHPVVGVTWYEALAFTRWLNRRWPGPSPARLLTEAEWEKAARGGTDIPTTPLIRPAINLYVPSEFSISQNRLPQRHYPWGNEFDSTVANSKESGIGKTNAVGCFVKNQSPYGIQEMSGNVYEWCQSLYQDYPYSPGREKLTIDAARVLRGGSYYTKSINARCFFRSWDSPDGGYSYGGFRVFRPYHL